MSLAFLYAGQGSQHAGMGADLYEAFPAFREVFDACAAELPFDLKKVCFEDPDGVLNQTEYTQPCMVAFAVGVTRLLFDAGIVPDYAAGLSLGEYSALQAAGVFTPEQAVSLVAFRGSAMAKASEGIDCGMTAVLGMERGPLQDICSDVVSAGFGHVQISNYNCPGQLVLGGVSAAVNEAASRAKEAGAKRCMPLNVSGPFHTSLLAAAGDALKERFTREQFGEMSFPVLFNCLGREKGADDTIPALLVRQVQSSVYMEDTIRRLAELGVDRIIEIGPGKALSGFVRKTCRDMAVTAVETVKDFEELQKG